MSRDARRMILRNFARLIIERFLEHRRYRISKKVTQQPLFHDSCDIRAGYN